jgi:hypothetical protein
MGMIRAIARMAPGAEEPNMALKLAQDRKLWGMARLKAPMRSAQTARRANRSTYAEPFRREDLTALVTSSSL